MVEKRLRDEGEGTLLEGFLEDQGEVFGVCLSVCVYGREAKKIRGKSRRSVLNKLDQRVL